MACPVIWIDFEDIFVHLETRSRPSGIQRLAFEAAREMVAVAPRGRVRLVRHARGGSGFREVPFDLAEAAYFRSVASVQSRAVRLVREMAPPESEALPPGGLRRLWRRIGALLPGEVRYAVLQVMMAQWQAVRAVPGVARAVLRAMRRTKQEQQALGGPMAPVVLAPGDVLFALAAPWGTEHVTRAEAVRAMGVHYAVLLYDLIPLVRPEFCVVAHAQRFRAWVDATLPICDIPLAISHATRRDVEAYARTQGIALRAPVQVVPIGTGFSGPAPDGSEEAPLLPAGSFVLFVSTIEARKNHALLFRVWRRLMDEMPHAAIPTLVFAGSPGWMVDDLMQQIRNSHFLDGKLAIVESPSDATLARLYRDAMFSVYPSFYEGWGLPVVESLGFGTPVVAARATSLPESGGTLARYFAPDDPADAARVIRGLIDDPAELARWREQVRQEFRPVSWRETAVEILAVVDRVIGPAAQVPPPVVDAVRAAG